MASPRRFPPQEVSLGEAGGKLAVVGWGSTFGPIHQAVRRMRAKGLDVSHIHVRHIWPLPANLGDLLKAYDKILVPEMNTGQFKTVLRDQFLVDARPLNKVSGQPFTIAEIEAAIEGAAGLMRKRRCPERTTMNDMTPIRDHAQGLGNRPGSPLVPRLRRLCDPQGGAAHPARARRRSGQDRVRLGHRLLEPLPVLRRKLWLPHHPRPRARRSPPASSSPIPSSMSGW